MKFGTSEVARILNVERNLIKSWAFKFVDYLKPEANPPKGITRQFCKEDIRVLAYISMYWEDDPDIESIKSGLNSNDHFESPYDELIIQVTPMFRELEDTDENGNGVLLGGMSKFGDTFAMAESYKLAGDFLVDSALDNNEEYELICPVIYNYRHATELYLKSTIGKWKNKHDLLELLQKLKLLLKTEFNVIPPDWFENIIQTFNDFDPNGTTFRYGGIHSKEAIADLTHIKTLMGLLAESFQSIKNQRKTAKY
jgi:hypothetical protein